MNSYKYDRFETANDFYTKKKENKNLFMFIGRKRVFNDSQYGEYLIQRQVRFEDDYRGVIALETHCTSASGSKIEGTKESLDKIMEINTDSGYAVIEPGVVFDRFTAAFAKEGFRSHVTTAPGGSYNHQRKV